MKHLSARVTENVEVLPGIARPHARDILGVRCIWLACPEIAAEARPGQFVMVRCGGECVLPRPFSIHQVNNDGITLLLNVWEGGRGTLWLSRRQPGENIDLFGPLGNGFSIDPGAKNLLLVAGGIGIAPMCFLAQEALTGHRPVMLLYGTPNAQRYPAHFLPPEIRVLNATDDGSVGAKCRVTELLPGFADWADQVFACGPVSMYRDMAQRKQRLKIEGKPVQVSLEVRMGCGLGVCYGCTVKTKSGLKQVCKDGPVFALDDILWEELKGV